MKKKAVIFDLDGTLLDTLTDLAISVNYALGVMGYKERTKEEVCSFVGNGVGVLIKKAVPQGTSDEDAKRTLGLFSEHYGKHMNDNTKPYDGIEELLAELKAAGIKTGVVSNKYDAAVKNLCARIFDDVFDVVAGERDGIARKPAPDGVFAVLAELNVDKKDAVYVGDADTDVLTAMNAGMDFIGVDWGFRSREVLEKAGAKVVVSSANELKSVLSVRKR